jgi:hypothetical protein
MIAVLGRGVSLSKYKDHHEIFDKIYIVNNFNVEIDTLRESAFKGKEIILSLTTEQSIKVITILYNPTFRETVFT